MDIECVRQRFMYNGYTFFVENVSNTKVIMVDSGENELTLRYFEEELDKMNEDELIDEIQAKINILT